MTPGSIISVVLQFAVQPVVIHCLKVHERGNKLHAEGYKWTWRVWSYAPMIVDLQVDLWEACFIWVPAGSFHSGGPFLISIVMVRTYSYSMCAVRKPLLIATRYYFYLYFYRVYVLFCFRPLWPSFHLFVPCFSALLSGLPLRLHDIASIVQKLSAPFQVSRVLVAFGWSPCVMRCLIWFLGFPLVLFLFAQ